MAALARNVAHVLIVMGLGPGQAAAFDMGEDQWELNEPGMLDDGETGQLALRMILVFTLAAVVWAVFCSLVSMAETCLEQPSAVVPPGG